MGLFGIYRYSITCFSFSRQVFCCKMPLLCCKVYDAAGRFSCLSPYIRIRANPPYAERRKNNRLVVYSLSDKRKRFPALLPSLTQIGKGASGHPRILNVHILFCTDFVCSATSFPPSVPQALQSGSPACAPVAEGLIPPPLSCLSIGFWYKFVPPSNGCSAFYQYPFSPPKSVKNTAVLPHSPQKFLRKIFGKVTISVIFSVL